MAEFDLTQHQICTPENKRLHIVADPGYNQRTFEGRAYYPYQFRLGHGYYKKQREDSIFHAVSQLREKRKSYARMMAGRHLNKTRYTNICIRTNAAEQLQVTINTNDNLNIVSSRSFTTSTTGVGNTSITYEYPVETIRYGVWGEAIDDKPVLETKMNIPVPKCILCGNPIYGTIRYPKDKRIIYMHDACIASTETSFLLHTKREDELITVPHKNVLHYTPKPKVSCTHNYSDMIKKALSWIIPMLHYRGRSYVTKNQVDEYLSANWHEIQNPYYRAKWFKPSETDDDNLMEIAEQIGLNPYTDQELISELITTLKSTRERKNDTVNQLDDSQWNQFRIHAQEWWDLQPIQTTLTNSRITSTANSTNITNLGYTSYNTIYPSIREDDLFV